MEDIKVPAYWIVSCLLKLPVVQALSSHTLGTHLRLQALTERKGTTVTSWWSTEHFGMREGGGIALCKQNEACGMQA
eukprot:1160534-Pelagomonas_calceolata.AAC.25